MPSPQPSPTGEGAGYSDFFGCWQFEKQLGFTTVDAGRLKSKKAANTTCFSCRTLNPDSHPVLSPRGRELERGQQAARLVFGAVGVLGKVTEIRRIPSPQPSPTGEGADCSRFCGCRQFEKQLGFTAVDFRSSEKQKAARTTCFPCRTFNPNSHPVLSPRGREPERGQQAARFVLGRLGCWGRSPKFGECPLPNPPPRGRE